MAKAKLELRVAIDPNRPGQLFTSCPATAQDQQVNTAPPPLLYPRVTWLEYFIRVPDWVHLVADLRETGSVDPFDYSFVFHEAIFLPKVRFATVEEARAVLDPMLEAWTIQTIITLNYSMSFTYMQHELAAQPPPIRRRATSATIAADASASSTDGRG
jgi:hypothetical protein